MIPVDGFPHPLHLYSPAIKGYQAFRDNQSKPMLLPPQPARATFIRFPHRATRTFRRGTPPLRVMPPADTAGTSQALACSNPPCARSARRAASGATRPGIG